jgi:DNA-binding transcriptional MerR regulator
MAPEPLSTAVFSSVVAPRLTGIRGTTLRKYQRQGLVSPSRAKDEQRLYAPEHLICWQQCKRLVADQRVSFAESPPRQQPATSLEDVDG